LFIIFRVILYLLFSHRLYISLLPSSPFLSLLRSHPLSLSEKYEYVEKILQVMEMTNLGDALIGDLETGWGISVEERKRLTIGMELVGRPKILFLDGM
jgi:ATP-binding cassette subfamily G (WHITE) protein 2 (SNQ2)